MELAGEYVHGEVHANGMENFWSLLKRGLSGTCVSVEPFHLFRYLDEQACRCNNRKEMNDYDRFGLAPSQITGKRLTYKHLTGRDRAYASEPAPTVIQDGGAEASANGNRSAGGKSLP